MALASPGRLPRSGRYVVRIGNDGERVWFAYPSAIENPVGYLAIGVLLEFADRNVIDPNERHGIVPDITALADGLDDPAAAVTVFSPARTFWEKATLIHVTCYRRRLAAGSERFSQHWFDLACFRYAMRTPSLAMHASCTNIERLG